MSLPQSLRARTVLLLATVLVVTHLVGLLLYAYERSSVIEADAVADLAEGVIVLHEILQNADKQSHAQIVKAASSQTRFLAELGPRPLIAEQSDTSGGPDVAATLEPVENASWAVFRSATAANFTDAARGWAPTSTIVRDYFDRAHFSSPEDLLLVSIPENGEWLNIVTSTPSVTPSFTFSATAAYVIGVLVAALYTTYWLVARVTEPLRQFAVAADQLGRDIDAPPLPETGPIEVRTATHAFNVMQHRLRSMIETRTRFLAAISHDLRTPITLLKLRAESVDQTETRERMLRTLDSMEEMTDSALAYVRNALEDEHTELVDLSALVESICLDWPDMHDRITIDLVPDIHLACRMRLLRRAIVNVIDNALKYGGKCEVTLRRAGETAELRVRDYGPGIPPSSIELVFQPFYRIQGGAISDGAEGVGLGLTIARDAIQAHGGRIALRNAAARGLEVVIRLPS